jgi:cysteine-rich repeat protein
VRAAAALLALVLALASCGNDGSGDGAGGGGFTNCGNGVLDDGESCDDGNQVDEDACLGTCQPNVCGDGFVDAAVEECDILPSATCLDRGFTGGTIACTDDCRIDTSGCTGQGVPTPAATPTADSGAPTATPTDGGATAPTPTPNGGGGGACAPGDPVVVMLGIDVAYGAARLDVQYPAAVNIPGSGATPDVVGRVEFAASGGLTTVNDDDNTATLTASFVAFSEQPAGLFATITFDCVSAVPGADAFTCTVVSASTPGGVAIPGAGCSVAVQ